MGIEGNEEIDRLAGAGCASRFIRSESKLGSSVYQIRTTINTWMKLTHQQLLKSLARHAHRKLLMENVTLF